MLLRDSKEDKPIYKKPKESSTPAVEKVHISHCESISKDLSTTGISSMKETFSCDVWFWGFSCCPHYMLVIQVSRCLLFVVQYSQCPDGRISLRLSSCWLFVFAVHNTLNTSFNQLACLYCAVKRGCSPATWYRNHPLLSEFVVLSYILAPRLEQCLMFSYLASMYPSFPVGHSRSITLDCLSA